ncbi:MAG: hypothetical protein HY856_15705 [Burkholderiales bacterium]|nr:hypothetical protein [Burkholderiales bacterium]
MHPATACIRPAPRRRGVPRATWAALALASTSITALVAVVMLDTEVPPPAATRTAQVAGATAAR